MVRDGNGPGSGLGIQLGYTATQVMSERASIPRATVKRLSLYLRELELHQSRGETTVSSRTLGGDLGITDAQVRRDFGYFGQFGQPGIGYSGAHLQTHKTRRNKIRMSMTKSQVDTLHTAVDLPNVGRIQLHTRSTGM